MAESTEMSEEAKEALATETKEEAQAKKGQKRAKGKKTAKAPEAPADKPKESQWKDHPFTTIVKKYLDILSKRDSAFAAKYNPEKILDCMDSIMDLIKNIVSGRKDPNVPDNICYKMARDYFLEGRVLEKEHYLDLIKAHEENLEDELFGTSSNPKKPKPQKKVTEVNIPAPNQIDLFAGVV